MRFIKKVIAGVIETIFADDPEVQEKVWRAVQNHHDLKDARKGNPVDALVAKAILVAYKFNKKDFIRLEETECISIGRIALVANKLFGRGKFTAHRIGGIIRASLPLGISARTKDGFYVKLNESKIAELAEQFQIDLDALEAV